MKSAFLCMFLLAASVVADLAQGQPSSDVPSKGDAPLSASAPMARWWWPNAWVDPAEIDRELAAVKSAGLHGVEISALPHKLKHIDPARYGWGSAAWNSAVKHCLQTAERLGLQVDITIGPAWPSLLPGLSPDALAAEKVLVYGMAPLAGGGVLDGLPQPAKAAPGVVKALHLEGLVAYPVTGHQGDTPTIDLAHAVDLTDTEAAKTGHWQAPKGDWLVMAFWMRGSGQKDNMRAIEGPEANDLTAPVGYVVDHFSKAGADAVTDYWDRHLLVGGIGELLKSVGGGIFEDSLELSGSPLWTPNFLMEFQARRGYSLRPWLPALFLSERMSLELPPSDSMPPPGTMPGGDGPPPGADGGALAAGSGGPGGPARPGAPATPAKPFAVDNNLRDRVVEDFEATLSSLYIEKRVASIARWAEGRGLHFRNQPYGPAIDSSSAAAATDVPEGESLGFGNAADSFRVLASGRDMAGRTAILSDECCADFGSGYAMTWRRMLDTIHANYAGGVNQIVIHGLAYGDDKLPSEWPGWAPMVPFGPLGTGFAEAWGPRIPTWQHLDTISAYLSRTQRLLRAGRPRVDLAVFRLGYQTNEQPLPEPGIPAAGYTYGMVSPALFDLPAAKVEGGILAPDGAGYRALVFAAPSHVALPAMEKILAVAKAGLPVFLVGPPPVGLSGMAKPAHVSRFQEILGQLPLQASVHNVPTYAGLVAALHKAGIDPAAMPDAPGTLVTVRRQTEADDLYWLYNDGPAVVDRQVSLIGGGPPTVINLWSGKEAVPGLYRRENGRTRVRVTLPPGATAAFRIPHLGTDRAHLESTTADDVLLLDGKLFARSSAAGTFEGSDGVGRLVASVSEVPGAVDLTGSNWTLDYEDWRPGSAPTQTLKGRHTVTLSGLHPWSRIAGLEDVGGIGRYSARFNISRAASGYVLDIGQVSDTVKVQVNGVAMPMDQNSHRIDLGSAIHAGENSITIEVATPLINRLRVTQPKPFAEHPRLDLGLLGPVRLEPYGVAQFVRVDSSVMSALPRASSLGIDVCPFVREVDTNGDGTMSESEWVAKVHIPVDIFHGMDHDGDGKVSCDEMDQNGPPPGYDTLVDHKLTVSQLNAIVEKMSSPPSGN